MDEFDLKGLTEKLEAFLEGLEGVTYGPSYNHHNEEWVQTSVAISRNGIEGYMAVLDHYCEDLLARLFPIAHIERDFCEKDREFVRGTYDKVQKGLEDLGFKIEEGDPDEGYILAW